MTGFLKVFTYWRLLVDGLLVTLQLSIVIIITSTILGILVGMLFTIKNKILQAILRFYVELFRGCPILMQLFMGYYGLAYLGIQIEIFTATVLVFTLYGGAYIAEIVRSGIESIPKGQWEAANCIGLSPFSVLKNVILPQSFKISLPPLIGFHLGMIKDTSIASIIGYSELLREGKTIMNVTGFPFQTYIILALIYFIICFPLSKFVSWTERRASI
jgi:polar amino acid transport system permease protein